MNWGQLSRESSGTNQLDPRMSANNLKSRVENLPVMNNKRLNKYSQKYMNDEGETVEKRCFFLFAGSDLNSGSAFNLELTFSKHDDPNI